MSRSFNLVYEPFVPCVGLKSLPIEYGLQEVLINAHKVAEIRDESPLVTVALHRLLLAVLHRCYRGPKNPAERIAIWGLAWWSWKSCGLTLQPWVMFFSAPV